MTAMTDHRASLETDTPICGMPRRDGEPCTQQISETAEACARHTEAAIAARATRKQVFLDEYDGAHGQANAAAAKAGISLSLLYVWKDADPEFAAAWAAKKVTNLAAYEITMAELFLEGDQVPVIHQGEITGWYRKRDRAAGEFMMRALAPDKYGNRVDVSVGLQREESEPEAIEALLTPGAFKALQATVDDLVVDAEIVGDE